MVQEQYTPDLSGHDMKTFYSKRFYLHRQYRLMTIPAYKKKYNEKKLQKISLK